MVLSITSINVGKEVASLMGESYAFIVRGKSGELCKGVMKRKDGLARMAYRELRLYGGKVRQWR